MKTRVVEGYNSKWGVNTYSVYKWAEWDDPELRRYYPGKFDWRYVTTILEMEKAISMAERISKDPEHEAVVVVWESDK